MTEEEEIEWARRYELYGSPVFDWFEWFPLFATRIAKYYTRKARRRVKRARPRRHRQQGWAAEPRLGDMQFKLIQQCQRPEDGGKKAARVLTELIRTARHWSSEPDEFIRQVSALIENSACRTTKGHYDR